MDTIAGFPPCPECDKILSLRSMPGVGETYWHCGDCRTQWATSDLIKALTRAEELAVVMAMARLDGQV